MTETLPQPPPNAPAPPPSADAQRSQKWWRWMQGVGISSIIIVILAISGLTSPMVIRSRKKSDLTEALQNARQIGMALAEFEESYGSFPDASTAGEVRMNTGSVLNMGATHSNDCFRQLIAAEILYSEAMFYAKTASSKKPDNEITGSKALAKGEVAFAYIAGLSATNHPETPIVLVPLLKGKRQFDVETCKLHYGGKAVILRVDNSVISVPVDKSGRASINGKDLFDPSQPFWGGKAPDVKWPE